MFLTGIKFISYTYPNFANSSYKNFAISLTGETEFYGILKSVIHNVLHYFVNDPTPDISYLKVECLVLPNTSRKLLSFLKSSG